MRALTILSLAAAVATSGCATSADQETVGAVSDAANQGDVASADVQGVDYSKPCKVSDGPATCDDGNACTNDVCFAICAGKSSDGLPCNAGFCQHMPLNVAGAACDDGNACTIGDTCKNSQCVPGTYKSCNDMNACTNDVCNPEDGTCVLTNNIDTCDDGNACTADDVCWGGKCKGTPTICNDGNGCTEDTCNKTVGCVFTKLSQAACDDSNPCTSDKCENGVCVSTPLVCEDGNPCTNDYCDGTAGGCVSTDAQAGSPCDDKNPCTTSDACSGGKCTSGQMKNCNDNNACTTDSCDTVSGQCVHTSSGLSTCDDNDACTQDDVCAFSMEKSGYVCAGKPLDCNDANPCTSDQCDPKVGCTHLTNNGVCNDYSPCTTDDVCKAGVCAGKAINCDDGNACTKDYCDPQIGCISKYTDGLGCDDGNACTKNDTCFAGACAGGVYIQCDDSNDCTSDSCNPNSGCVFKNVSNGAACDDGNQCTTSEKCKEGKCMPGATVNCDDGNSCTTDSCNPGTGKCIHTTLPNYTACDDGNQCTSGDWCYSDKGCVGIVQKFCNDNNSCTVDSCDPTNGKCHNTPIPDCKP